MSDASVKPHAPRGAQIAPTSTERRELIRAAKARALDGDPLAVHSLALFEFTDELRRARRAGAAGAPLVTPSDREAA